MNMKIKTFAFLGVIILVLLAGSIAYRQLSKRIRPEVSLGTSKSEENTSTDAKSLPKASDFMVHNIDREEVTLSEHFGKPIVVNFWASWCPPCREEMPDFEAVYQDLGDQVTFMMVNLVDGTRETIESGTTYIAEGGYTFPIYFDVRQEAAYAYAITSIPTTLFINAEGVIVGSAIGAIDEETLKKGIAMIVQ